MRSLKTAWVLVGVAVVLSGCGGCQEEGKPPLAPASNPTVAPAAPGAAGKEPVTPAPGAAQLEGEVDETELIVWASGEPDSGPVPLTVTFSVESLEEGFDNPSYKWDFGDGSSESTEASPTHTYEKSGQYTARVTVTQANGLKGEDETWVEVDDAEG